MTKHIITLLVLMIVSGTVTAQKNVLIRGFVHGDTKGFNKIYLYGQNIKEDSVNLQDSAFEFSFPYEQEVVALFYSEYDIRSRGGYAPAVVVIDQPGKFTISNINIEEGLNSGMVKGTVSAENFFTFSKRIKEVNKSISKILSSTFDSVPGYESKEFESYNRAFDSISRKILPVEIKNLVKSLKDSYGTAMGVEMYGKQNLEVKDLEDIYHMLGTVGKKSEPGENIHNYLDGLKNSAIGKQALNFSLPSPEGKEVSLSSLKGKYVWIDFWASWCGPCKQSFPSMKKLYSKYRDKDFEIVGVSIDKDKNAWLKGLKEEALPWPQTLDTKSIAAKGFAITAVPTGYLLDPNGKIILKEIGFEEGGSMDKKLKELFGQ